MKRSNLLFIVTILLIVSVTVLGVYPVSKSSVVNEEKENNDTYKQKKIVITNQSIYWEIDEPLSHDSYEEFSPVIIVEEELNIMIGVYSEEEYLLFEPYLLPGDFIISPLKLAKLIKSEHPEINTVVGGKSLEILTERIPKQPSWIDFIAYDYEKNTSPEWTRNQTQSKIYLETAANLSRQYDFGFISMPILRMTQNWNWTDLTYHDMINFQCMTYAKNDKLAECGVILEDIIPQLDTDTLIFTQFGFKLNTVEQIYQGIDAVKTVEGVDGVTIWGSKDNPEAVQQLLEILESLRG